MRKFFASFYLCCPASQGKFKITIMFALQRACSTGFAYFFYPHALSLDFQLGDKTLGKDSIAQLIFLSSRTEKEKRHLDFVRA